jgi:hypothetical protein
MKVLMKALQERDQSRIDRLCTVFVDKMEEIEPSWFLPSEVSHIINELTFIHTLTFNNMYDKAIERISMIISMCHQIRDTRFGVVNVLRAGWYIPTQNNEFSLGMLDALPCLVRSEIAKCLEREYNII